METVEALKWLKENNLYEEAKKASFYVKKVFAPCLGVQEEKILIVGDTGSQNRQVSAVLSGAYYLAALDLNLDTKLVFQAPKSRGDIADDDAVNN